MLLRLPGLLPILFALSSPILAQSQTSQQALAGIVEDQNGAIIVGASVELHQNSQLRQAASTNAAGSFRFDRLIPGRYQLLVTSRGFEPYLNDIEIDAQSPKPMRIVLVVGRIHSETTIDGDDYQVVTESSQNQNAARLSGETLSHLPIFDQDYLGMMARFLDPASVATAGSALIVDGVEAKGLLVSPSAVKEVKINQDPYSAEFPRPGRGRIEVSTKPGSAGFHGTFNFLFRDARLNARDPFALVRAPEQRRIYEGMFTGPINRSRKTFFVISVDRSEEDLQAVVFARVPAGAFRENVPVPTRNLLISGQVNYVASKTQSYAVRFSTRNRTIFNQGVGGPVLAEAGTTFQFREEEVNISHDLVLSPKLLNQFRLLLGHFYHPFGSVKPGQKIVVLDAFTGVGAQVDHLHTEYHFALNNVLSYSAGRNLFKTGINIPDWSRRASNNNSNRAGTFYFSSLEDYFNNSPYLFTLSEGEGRVVFVEKVLGGFVMNEHRLRPNLMLSMGLRYDWQNYFQDANNFSPRLSFAYAPSQNQSTVIRGGVGLFYDRTGPRPILDLLHFGGSGLRSYRIANPRFPDPFNDSSLPGQPISLVRFEPKIKIPYQLQFGIGVEQQLTKSLTVSLNYVGIRGVSLLRTRDINAPLPPDYWQRPDAGLGALNQIESAGRSQSDALEASFRGNVTRYFKGTLLYRVSRSYNNTAGLSYMPPNTYDLSGEWGRSNDDRRHRLDLLGTINPGKLFNLGIVLAVYSGAPYTLTTGRDEFGTGIAARPPGVGRNTLQGPDYVSLDLRWSRDVFLVKQKGEKGPTISMGVDAFNVLNRVNFTNFIGNLSSPFFGRAVSAQPSRRIQVTFRFKF